MEGEPIFGPGVERGRVASDAMVYGRVALA